MNVRLIAGSRGPSLGSARHQAMAWELGLHPQIAVYFVPCEIKKASSKGILC